MFMKIERFEDIIAWQKAKELTLLWYRSIKRIEEITLFVIKYCVRVSTANNIAEDLNAEVIKNYGSFYLLQKGSSGEYDLCLTLHSNSSISIKINLIVYIP